MTDVKRNGEWGVKRNCDREGERERVVDLRKKETGKVKKKRENRKKRVERREKNEEMRMRNEERRNWKRKE